MVRTRQQGFGKPIISVKHDGFRLVAVKNRIFWAKDWVFFTDFLLVYLKDVLGREWGQRALAEGLDHSVFRWLAMLNRKEGLGSERTEDGVRELGYMTSLFRLAYSLYLIAHHDQVAPSLVARLRSARPDTFRPAVYETFVAAAFAVAGFAIEGAELVRSSRKTPEFWATSPSGARYAVEAKCKLTWKCACDTALPEFRDELRAWLRDQIYKSSLKQLARPVYWFELSIPAEFNEADYQALREVIVATLHEAEGMTIKGEPPAPAYVFVTNNSHMVMDLVAGSPFAAVLEGYRMEDMRAGRQVSLEEAFEIRDRHREILRVFECLSEVQRVPMSFDGYAAELLGPDGEPASTLKIGQQVHLDFPDGRALEGTLREITVLDDVGWVIVEEATGNHRMATMPLTSQEALAARAYGEAVFGKPEGPHRNLEGDPVALYDWFLKVFAGYSDEALMRQISSHPASDQIAALPLAEKRARVARELAKSAHATSQKRRTHAA